MSDHSISLPPIRNSEEKNLKTIERAVWQNPEFKGFRESLLKRRGIDLFDKKSFLEGGKFPCAESNFSWRKVKEKLELREADSASSWAQLLRAGVQTNVNNAFQSVPVTYTKWAQVVQSKRDTELYAPLHGIGFPREVGRQETYPEVRAAGLDIKLTNRKFGEMFSIEEELLMDDQTNQMAGQTSWIGQYLGLVYEVYAYAKLASVGSMQYADLTIPTSETKPSTESSYPFSTSFVGGGANRPASFGAPTLSNIQNAITGLNQQKNLLGLKMGVQGDTLILSPVFDFDVSILLSSSAYPAGAQAAGVTGGAFADNPLKSVAAGGPLKKVMSRFVFKNDGTVNSDSRAWYLADTSKPFFIVQMRSAAEVTQEAANSGQSFDRDVIRFKGRTRGNADYIDPRFIWQGNDGSV